MKAAKLMAKILKILMRLEQKLDFILKESGADFEVALNATEEELKSMLAKEKGKIAGVKEKLGARVDTLEAELKEAMLKVEMLSSGAEAKDLAHFEEVKTLKEANEKLQAKFDSAAKDKAKSKKKKEDK